MGQLDNDSRWLKLNGESWKCPCCGEMHNGLPDLGFHKPQYWSENVTSPNSAIRSDSTDILTEDFCVLDGEHYFVRCLLILPIIGAAERHFGIGVWSSLSKQNFLRYVETFGGGSQGREGPWFGWFSNNLHGYPPTAGLQCDVQPRDGDQRPTITIGDKDAEHPLAIEQRCGITFDRILDLFALNGHDIRPGLEPAK